VAQQHSHALIDCINAEQDRVIARKLRRHPRVLRLAQANLRRWSARDGKRVRPVFAEWKRILYYLNRSEIADFLVSETPMCRRLRQSSPFAGALSEAEVSKIRRNMVVEELASR